MQMRKERATQQPVSCNTMGGVKQQILWKHKHIFRAKHRLKYTDSDRLIRHSYTGNTHQVSVTCCFAQLGACSTYTHTHTRVRKDSSHVQSNRCIQRSPSEAYRALSHYYKADHTCVGQNLQNILLQLSHM